MQDDDQVPTRGDNRTSPESDAGTDREVPTILYRIRPGDDLQSVAAQFYGRRDFWVFIFLANPGEIHGLGALPPGKFLSVPVLPTWESRAVPASQVRGIEP